MIFFSSLLLLSLLFLNITFLNSHHSPRLSHWTDCFCHYSWQVFLNLTFLKYFLNYSVFPFLNVDDIDTAIIQRVLFEWTTLNSCLSSLLLPLFSFLLSLPLFLYVLWQLLPWNSCNTLNNLDCVFRGIVTLAQNFTLVLLRQLVPMRRMWREFGMHFGWGGGDVKAFWWGRGVVKAFLWGGREGHMGVMVGRGRGRLMDAYYKGE